MNELERLRAYQAARLPDCILCQSWFLGCLNGREKWKDKAVSPGKKYIGKSGAEFEPEEIPPDHEYPVRAYCDAFTWDIDPDRLGRVVK